MKKLTLLLVLAVSMAFASQAKADIVMDTYNNGNPSAGGYWWFGWLPPGLIGVEDYVADQVALNNVATLGSFPNYTFMDIDSFQFVGGAQNANDVITFDFYDSNAVFYNSFSFGNGANAGLFNWSLGLGSFRIPTVGFITMTTQNGPGSWFFSDPLNTVVGASPLNPDNMPLVGPGTGPANYAFRMNAINAIPEPSSALALLAVVGVGLVVRRRS